MKQQFVMKKFTTASLATIDKVNGILDEYRAQGYDLSLRQLYYQLVARGLIENTVRSYKNTGSLVSDARLAGLVDWGMIKDRGREQIIPAHWSSPADILDSAAHSFRTDKWRDQDNLVLVAVEKQALEGVLIPVCRVLDVAFIANKGYSSSSSMYEIGQRLREECSYPTYKNVHILYLGDHDPSGIDMSRDVRERLEMFMEPYKPNMHRVALNYDQVEALHPPENPAKEALALDTPIPTPTGWTTMGEILPGDTVFGLDGQPYPVTGASEVFPNKRCCRLTFSCGDSIVCSEDHLWTVTAWDRVGGTVPTSEIARKWRDGKDNKPIWRVPVAASLDLPDVELPIPPYTFGAWLGDGSIGEGSLVCHEQDDEVRRNIVADGFAVSRYDVKNCRILGLRGAIHSLGMARDKWIPPVYLRSGCDQRQALVQGLMDTDGTVGDPAYRKIGACDFGNSRSALAEGFLELINTLGIRGRMSESRAVLNGKDYGAAYRVEFYPGDADVFRLARKRSRLRGIKVSSRQHWRTIINVEDAASVPTRCIAVGSPDHLFLAGRHFIATHNTDSRFAAYQAQFGDSSWELDAIEPAALARLVTEAVVGLRDDEQWQYAVGVETEMRTQLRQYARDYRRDHA